MSLNRYGGGSSGAAADLADHLNDTADAHDASAISFAPTGTIAATDVQAAIAEVSADVADVLDGSTFTGPIVLADGSAAAPSLRVGDEQNGLYSPAANQLGFAVAGARAAYFTSGGVLVFDYGAEFPDGTAAAPSVQIGGEENGFYSPAANQLAMTLNGVLRYTFVGEADYRLLGIGSSPSAWGGSISPVDGMEFGDRGALAQLSGSAYLYWNTKYNSSYAEVARTATGVPAALIVGAGAVTLKAAATNPGAGSTITFTTLLTARGNSDMDVSLDCGRLKFPATQNASSDANTLDDYEENTWVPTVTSQTGSITSSTLTSATYTKVGRKVTVSVNLTITNAGTGAGSLLVTLPFTAMAQAFVGSGYEGALTGNMLWVLVGASGTQMQIRNYNNTTCIATNANVIATVTYFV